MDRNFICIVGFTALVVGIGVGIVVYLLLSQVIN